MSVKLGSAGDVERWVVLSWLGGRSSLKPPPKPWQQNSVQGSQGSLLPKPSQFM